MADTPRCRKCGCYDYVHDPAYNPFPVGSPAHAARRPVDHRFSRATRVERWFMDHGTLWNHVKAWAWLHLRTGRSRWAYIDRLWKRSPGTCWCSLVDSWWYAEPSMRGDYVGKEGRICDFPLPSASLHTPPEGGCYCTPAPSPQTPEPTEQEQS